MHRTRDVALPVLVFLVAVGPQHPAHSGESVPAGHDAIAIGGARLYVGMPRARALEALSAEFDVREDNRSSEAQESWLVWTKDKTFVGNVSVKNGLVWSVIKNWGPEDGSGAPLVKAFLGAVSALVRDGRKDCTLDRDEQSGPGWESRAVLIVCGKRHLKMEVLSSQDPKIGERASVSENLGGKPGAARLIR
jgi:hypothetical protein